MRLSPEHVREKLQSDRTEISGEKRERESQEFHIRHRCGRSLVSGICGGGEGEKPSAFGEEPVTIVVPRVQDFLLQTGDTTVGVPDNTHTHTLYKTIGRSS